MRSEDLLKLIESFLISDDANDKNLNAILAEHIQNQEITLSLLIEFVRRMLMKKRKYCNFKNVK